VPRLAGALMGAWNEATGVGAAPGWALRGHQCAAPFSSGHAGHAPWVDKDGAFGGPAEGLTRPTAVESPPPCALPLLQQSLCHVLDGGHAPHLAGGKDFKVGSMHALC